MCPTASPLKSEGALISITTALQTRDARDLEDGPAQSASSAGLAQSASSAGPGGCVGIGPRARRTDVRKEVNSTLSLVNSTLSLVNSTLYPKPQVKGVAPAPSLGVVARAFRRLRRRSEFISTLPVWGGG
eukprot:1149222-Prorocentrum_minimum.AAC.1